MSLLSSSSGPLVTLYVHGSPRRRTLSSARARVCGGAVLLLVTACSAPSGACTEIGAVPGVGVTVEKASAAGVTALSLRVCWAGDCTDRDVALSPGSDSIDQGCEGDEPDAACSATVVPNGTLVGFAEVPGLPAGEVLIGASVERGERSSRLPEVAIQAETSYPNGPRCEPAANQAQVTIGRDGMR